MMTPFVTQWEALSADAIAPLGLPAHPWLMGRFGWQAFRSATALAQSAFRGARARALLAGLAAHSVLPLDVIPSSAEFIPIKSWVATGSGAPGSCAGHN